MNYKIAEASKHTLTNEFLLRLLRTAGDLLEDVVAEFFGFDAAETRYVIDEAEGRGLVFRMGGRVHLAAAGLAAFDKGGDRPQLYEVHSRRGRFDFDVVSFAPAEAEHLTPFTRALSELPVLSQDNLARASETARYAFRRHFRELHIGRRGTDLEGMTLYTIDDVVSDRRRDALVPLGVDVPLDTPKRTQPNLQEWSADHDLPGREDVVSSCAAFVRSLEVEHSWTADEAYKLLVDVAPEQTARFRRVAGFDRLAFFRHGAGRTGDVQANRRTVPIIGTLWTAQNVGQLSAAIRLLKREKVASGPPLVFWLRPALPHWGSNRSLPEFVAGLTGELEPPDEDGPEPQYTSIGAGATIGGPLQQRWRGAFDRFVPLHPEGVPPGLEVFLIPRRLVAVLVHGALDGSGFPVPVGILSADPGAVERAHGIVDEILARAAPATTWNEVETELREALYQALDFAASPGAAR
ncbi:hypothetical protein NON00_15215 [Roseomonas sp. GC11]|uniref:hypothetical protein n=1 Tax=Roseomonas sp. GC11 TaxID=2950546 RepID=UPI00210A754C|nr:hypothetical protein [Roseomonas sp. GC11]MCQ4161270.1 hypothetical protein [Roseomonas sp. GC11]